MDFTHQASINQTRQAPPHTQQPALTLATICQMEPRLRKVIVAAAASGATLRRRRRGSRARWHVYEQFKARLTALVGWRADNSAISDCRAWDEVSIVVRKLLGV